jgi:hypothetical protein
MKKGVTEVGAYKNSSGTGADISDTRYTLTHPFDPFCHLDVPCYLTFFLASDYAYVHSGYEGILRYTHTPTGPADRSAYLTFHISRSHVLRRPRPCIRLLSNECLSLTGQVSKPRCATSSWNRRFTRAHLHV